MVMEKSKIKHLPRTVVRGIVSPFEQFAAIEASSGILLILVTALAMYWANSPWRETYLHLIELPLGINIGSFELMKTLHHWVNDGLMVIFFFMVGLEIKRELVVGELSSPRKAALPMAAALGGMVAPALIYASLNHSGLAASGWGIPMATDIAFAVGVLTLMSRKVPFALKVFLLALAIVDDLGAVLVIAFFYTEQIIGPALAIATGGVLVTLFLKYAGVRKIWVYWIVGAFVWFFVLKSGVHATVAGVILGLITPVKSLYNLTDMPAQVKRLVDTLASSMTEPELRGEKLSDESVHRLDELHDLVLESKSPLDRLVHQLHSVVSYVIMPIFAFVNAGVSLSGDLSFSEILQNHITLGVILGLVIGKPVGIMLFSWAAIKLGMAELPRGVTWRQMLSVACLGGIGFTMALFVSHLALKTPEVELYSKMGILMASAMASGLGLFLLWTSKDVRT